MVGEKRLEARKKIGLLWRMCSLTMRNYHTVEGEMKKSELRRKNRRYNW
jgi:hypothetical protein